MASESANLSLASVPRIAEQSQRQTSATETRKAPANLALAGGQQVRSVRQGADLSVLGAQESGQAFEQKDLTQLVDKINEFVQSIQRELRFSIDESSRRTVIKVFDAETDEVIRQIPAEEILNMVNRLNEVSGILLKDQA